MAINQAINSLLLKNQNPEDALEETEVNLEDGDLRKGELVESEGKVSISSKSSKQKIKDKKTTRLKDQNKAPKRISKKELHLDRLKSYVNRCGVRKVWKKELAGLDTTESIEKVNQILKDLGMEGICPFYY